MQLWKNPSSLLAFTTLLLSQSTSAVRIPDFLQSLEILQNLEKRCDNPCGYYGQLCCASNEVCYTDASGQAQCGAGSNSQSQGGTWEYVTTTYVQTDLQTVTATYSTYIPAATQAPTTMSCSYAQGQSPCGSTCCNSGQYCQANNMCVQVPGGSSGYYSSLYTVTTVVTNTAGVPLRPTTQTVLTLTSTGVSSTTAFQTPVGTDGAILTGAQSSSGGLSGGAIAGIVIGVIAGIILLLLLCACCCFKGLLDGLLAIFGLGPRRRRVTEETIIEERHSHRSGGRGRTWFGTRPNKTTEVVEEKKSGKFGRTLGVAAFLGTVAVLLGLKRKHDHQDDKSSTGYYGSDYYSYDYTSDSSPSSITRTSRRSRSRR